MASFVCRVQFLDDTDPFNSTNFPEPSRPPLYTFRVDIPLVNQIAGVQRLLRAPHKIDDCALQLSHNSAYLDLEATLEEQQDEMEGFHEDSGRGKKHSIILRTKLSIRVHACIEKLYSFDGRELRRALFSLKQIFQDDKDLVHEFVKADGLKCLIKLGAESDQNYQNYILRALGQIMLYIDGMNGIIDHNETIQWLYTLIGSKFRLVVKTSLKLLLVFVEYTETNSLILAQAVNTFDIKKGVKPWSTIMDILKEKDGVDTELLVHMMTLINKTLEYMSDDDLYYDILDCLEELGMESVVNRYLNKKGTDLDLVEQCNIYENTFKNENGDGDAVNITKGRRMHSHILQTLIYKRSLRQRGENINKYLPSQAKSCSYLNHALSAKSQSKPENTNQMHQSSGKSSCYNGTSTASHQERTCLGGLLTSSYRQHQESLAAERVKRRQEREARLQQIEREERNKFQQHYLDKMEEHRQAREERYKNVEKLAAEEYAQEVKNKNKCNRKDFSCFIENSTFDQTDCSKNTPEDYCCEDNVLSTDTAYDSEPSSFFPNVCHSEQKSEMVSNAESECHVKGELQQKITEDNTDNKACDSETQHVDNSTLLSEKEKQNEESNEKDLCSGSSVSSSSSTLEMLEKGESNENETAAPSSLRMNLQWLTPRNWAENISNKEDNEHCDLGYISEVLMPDQLYEDTKVFEEQDKETDDEIDDTKVYEEQDKETDDEIDDTKVYEEQDKETDDEVDDTKVYDEQDKEMDDEVDDKKVYEEQDKETDDEVDESKQDNEKDELLYNFKLSTPVLNSSKADESIENTDDQKCGKTLDELINTVTEVSEASRCEPDLDIAVQPKKDADFMWDQMMANLKELRIKDMDFTDLGEEDDFDVLNIDLDTKETTNIFPPIPPPPFNCVGLLPPPPLPPSRCLNANPPCILPPPLPLSVSQFCGSPQLLRKEPVFNKKKKTIRLFWNEVRPFQFQPFHHLRYSDCIWSKLESINLDTSKLEYLFESKSKDLPVTKKCAGDGKKQEVIVLDSKRSNAINIGLTILPPPRTIKMAILNFDEYALNKEGIDKILTMIPTEEETQRIQEAQLASPDIPLGSAEQFLLTLSSISELSARLHLWAFKMDYELMEKEITEPLYDLKEGMNQLENNKTFAYILSTLLATGNFLNGTNAKAFDLSYLQKVPEVKDTVQKQPLLYHMCTIIAEKFPDSTDLYSEIGSITRSSKVDFDQLHDNLRNLEKRCKASWDYLKIIAKHEMKPALKQKMSDFLKDCAERIIILKIVHRRIINRFHSFLLFMGHPSYSIHEVNIQKFCRNITEFALEYRTSRDRVLQQKQKWADHKERNKTRGKLITDTDEEDDLESGSVSNYSIFKQSSNATQVEISKGLQYAEDAAEHENMMAVLKGSSKNGGTETCSRTRSNKGLQYSEDAAEHDNMMAMLKASSKNVGRGAFSRTRSNKGRVGADVSSKHEVSDIACSAADAIMENIVQSANRSVLLKERRRSRANRKALRRTLESEMTQNEAT
ncbi:FH1/FH2 domain-containing protein 3 isoform X3 [Xenopus laevis]|uniref:FH1/FH2 domain-containing protein 3 isoform X3 n=1 Tax=Xenopus laevis TaxID=8355 RepID=A0A8J0VJD1_XENLA|nr:FH1/FH2 domain-containing protein 3 isoform X3 [Xenopus laevis]